MRSVILLTGLSLSATLLACDARPLAGPDVPPLALVAAPAGQRAPLIFVDGRPLPRGASLAQLNALDIELIEVLKGQAAAKLYGESGLYGVIQIHTKSGRSGR